MDESTWSVSADASLQSVLDDPACPPLLSRVLTAIHSWQVRNETMVGRTLRASQLMPQWLAALLALGAVVSIKGDDGVEEVGLEALVERQGKGDVEALHVPRRAGVVWGEARVARTPSDDPIVAALAVVESSDGVVEGARVALTGVSSRPVWLSNAPRALLGQALDPDRIAAVASAVGEEVQPEGDYLGSAGYRRAMAKVVTRRALEDCLARLDTGGLR
jgi:CO/xanthine dehydrogenase FAD-binding subunit